MNNDSCKSSISDREDRRILLFFHKRGKGSVMKRKVLAALAGIMCMMILLSVFPFHAFAEGELGAEEGDEKTQENTYASIEDYVKAHDVELGAFSYVYIKDGEMNSRGILGYSDLSENRKVNTSEQVFEWGEASQILVWISLIQLYEEGKIDFDKDIMEYLPTDYRDVVSIKYPITVRQLMNHTSGFQENLYERYVYEGMVNYNLITYMISNQPKQTSKPGSVVSYSEYGICLGALVVQGVTGMAYEDYVKENIFIPLSMDCTSVRADQKDNDQVAALYKESRSYENGVRINSSRLVSPYYPANMTVGTIDDYAKLNMALLKEDSGLFAKKESYGEFLSATLNYRNSELPRISHGLYHYEFGDSVIGVRSSSQILSNVFYLNPQMEEGLVVMTNMYGEEDYTKDLPEYVFGKPSEAMGDGLNTNLSEFEGIFLPAGTISKGKLSYYSLLLTRNLVPTLDGGLGIRVNKTTTPFLSPMGQGWAKDDTGRPVHLAASSDGVKTIEFPEMDYLTYPKFQFLFGYGILIAQVISYAFATLVLTVAIFHFVYMKIKRQEEPKQKFRKYLYIQCGNIAFFTWIFMAMFFMALSYSKKALIDTTASMYYIGTLISTGYIVLAFTRKHGEDVSKLEKVLYYAAGACGVIMIVFSVFFRLIFSW